MFLDDIFHVKTTPPVFFHALAPAKRAYKLTQQEITLSKVLKGIRVKV